MKRFYKKILRLSIVAAVFIVMGLILPNWFIAPKLKAALLKELRSEDRLVELDSLFINIFTTTVVLKDFNIAAVDDGVGLNLLMPRTEVEMGLMNLLTGRLEPETIRFVRPDAVVFEPVEKQAALGSSMDAYSCSFSPLGGKVRMGGNERAYAKSPSPHSGARGGYAQASCFPSLSVLAAIGQSTPKGSSTIREVRVEQGLFKYRHRGSPEYVFLVDRVEILLEDIVFDANHELRKFTLKHLIAYWPDAEKPGISFTGEVSGTGDGFTAVIKGSIMGFPFLSVREPIKEAYDIDVSSGNADLISDIVVNGPIMDSTHSLVVRNLEMTTDRSLFDTEESNYGKLLVELLRYTSGGEEHVVNDIVLHGDLSKDPEGAFDRMAQDALDQIATALANDLLDRLRREKDKFTEKLKELGESILDAFE